MKTKLILIGGVPGTGKTTIAYKIALRLGIDKVVSIDMVKAMTRTFKDLFSPYVFTTTHEAYKLEGLSVIDGFLKHCDAINEIVLNIVDNISDKVIIIDGATLNKEILNKIDKDKYDIAYVNLYLNKEDLINRYKKKNKMRKGKWIENIDIIDEINEYLKKDNFNIENINLEEAVERILEYVKKNLCL